MYMSEGKKIKQFTFGSFIEGGEEKEYSFKEAKERIASGEKIVAAGEIIYNKQKTRVRTAHLTEVKFVKGYIHLITNQMIYQIEYKAAV